jgi:capsular polysaccharide biosynthesis protein
MRLYRQFFLDAQETTPFEGRALSSPRIYLSRPDTVRPFNEHEVRTALEKHDFFTVKIEDYSFLEQVQIFAGAEIIVSTTGAQWTGAIFSSGAKCLIMEPDFLAGSSLFSKLLHLGNGVLLEISMEVVESRWFNYVNSRTPGHVDIGQLERGLKELLSH